jgi:hypothetical protein
MVKDKFLAQTNATTAMKIVISPALCHRYLDSVVRGKKLIGCIYKSVKIQKRASQVMGK